MDLEAYISRYSGETRLQRLLLIAKTTSSDALANQAFSLAEEQIKRDGNVKRYNEIFGFPQQQQVSSILLQQQEQASQGSGFHQQQQQQASNLLQVQQEQQASQESAAQQSHHHHHRLPKTAYDNEWVQTTEASNKNARHVLQGRLSAAKSHLHKEAIRSAYIALAQHDAKTGELRGAMGYLLRATDYCTTRSQTAHISLLILELALHLESYAQVREYVTKVEHTLGGAATNTPTSTNTGSVEQVATKLKIASGLQQLAQGDYTAAARSLSTLITTTSPSSGWDWSAVSSPEDLCLYASLLSLATQDRATIMQLAEHPEALELVPAMREVLRQFGRANYKGCCESLFDAVNNTLLPFPDFYLSKHWTALTRRIREKCLIEYLKPYECVQLGTMAQQFPFPDLEDMLVDLIGKGLVPARLDCQRGILQKVPAERKPPNLKHLERRVLDDTYALLVRLACLENELCVYDESARSRRPAAASARDYDDETSSSETEDTPMLDVSELQAANPEDLY